MTKKGIYIQPISYFSVLL